MTYEIDDLERAVNEANACDGFRVMELIRGNLYYLYMGYYVDGELTYMPGSTTDGTTAVPLVKFTDPNHEEIGRAKRIKLFAEAMCRFLNSGGDWHLMRHFVDRCRHDTAETRTAFADYGFRLLDSCINADGQNEHVFAAHGERRVIRWVEDSFIETIPDYLLQREWDEMEAADAGNDGSGPGQEVQGELPSRQDRRDEERGVPGGEVPPPEHDPDR
jgi:hypothetical protein